MIANTDTQTANSPKVLYTLQGLADQEKADVKHRTQHNLINKMSAYLNKYYAHNPDVVIKIKITIKKQTKGTQGTYSGSFLLKVALADVDDSIYIRENFKSLIDLVNHAFDHFKVDLSKQ